MHDFNESVLNGNHEKCTKSYNFAANYLPQGNYLYKEMRETGVTNEQTIAESKISSLWSDGHAL